MRLPLLPLIMEREAEDEVEAAVRWYERRREGLGDRFLAELDEAMLRIEESPLAGSFSPNAASDLGVRRVLLDRFPYFVAYLMLPTAIHVIAVGHEHRRPGYYLRRVRRLL